MKTFKSILCAGIIACLTWSCSSTQYYYQISQTKPLDETIVKSNNDDSGYFYQDQNCRISYNFWSENGDAGFTVTNLTDEVLYVLKDKCFFVKNGVSYDYFHNTDVTETAYGKTKHTQETSIIGIAPKSSKTVSEYNIYPFVYLNCDLNRKPTSKNPETMTFSPENSPVIFGNYITYKVGQNDKEIGVSNMFYTSRITNYLKSDLFTTETRENCPNVSDITRYTQKLIRFAPTTGYFIQYIR